MHPSSPLSSYHDSAFGRSTRHTTYQQRLGGIEFVNVGWDRQCEGSEAAGGLHTGARRLIAQSFVAQLKSPLVVSQ